MLKYAGVKVSQVEFSLFSCGVDCKPPLLAMPSLYLSVWTSCGVHALGNSKCVRISVIASASG